MFVSCKWMWKLMVVLRCVLSRPKSGLRALIEHLQMSDFFSALKRFSKLRFSKQYVMACYATEHNLYELLLESCLGILHARFAIRWLFSNPFFYSKPTISTTCQTKTVCTQDQIVWSWCVILCSKIAENPPEEVCFESTVWCSSIKKLPPTFQVCVV